MRLSTFAAPTAGAASLSFSSPARGALRARQAFAQAPAATRVGTVLAEKQPVNPAQEFVGRIEAIERVEVRARVTGFLQEILFKEGDTVKEGEAAYRIEPRAVSGGGAAGARRPRQGEGQRRQRQPASSARAETLADQAGGLRRRPRRAARRRSRRQRATISMAEANLQTAKINLDYTEIKAPISGLIGRTSVTKGNVVGPDSGLLTLDRQPGPDVCGHSRQPARISCSSRATSAAAAARA